MTKCYSSFAGFLIMISKIKVLINFLDFFNFFNVCRGYGANYGYLSYFNLQKYNYLASEANQKRYEPKYKGWENINVYIVKKDTLNGSEKDINNMRFFSHYVDNIKHFAIILLIVGIFFHRELLLKKII